MPLQLLRTLGSLWLYVRRCGRRGETPPPPPFPTFQSGGALVDVADRNALYDLLDANEGP